MKKMFQSSIGVDVSKDSLVCCRAHISTEGSIVFGRSKTFANTPVGFRELLTWSGEKGDQEMVFIMEATGVYYENLAYWLDSHGRQLCVQLPGKVRFYGKSHNIKTKTDGVDAQLLARMGLERELRLWKMPSESMRQIKYLAREYKEVRAKLVVCKNQLHAKTHGHGCPVSVERRLKRVISLLETQLMEIEAELRMKAMADTALYDRISKICTIPGISFMTVICILAETNAFALVTNSRQLVSYAGLDIQQNQSGNKQGKSRISKKGNSFIRNALYMPALSASKCNPNMKEFYDRLIERKPAKKIGVTAVARKLLILIYILWKDDQEFDPKIEESRQVYDPPTQDEHNVLLNS